MVFFTLRVHIAKLKLLVPLHTSNHKLYLKITAQDDSKKVEAPQITNEMITKNNGVIHIIEDLEFKLDQKCNKISVFIYANRTFKEDILLFFNDVSLRKPLSTEQIVKIEAKLYNSDKVNVANLYLEMQRQGQIISNQDFMADITQRLNIEASKVIKHEQPEEQKTATMNHNSSSPGFFASLQINKDSDKNKKSNRAKSQERETKQASSMPSSLEITQQLFAIPNLGFSMQEQREKAIPGFDPFLMGDNFQRFLRSIDVPVQIYEYLFQIFTIQNSKETFNFLIQASVYIYYYEYVLCLLPLALVLFIFYNFYFKKEFKRPTPDYIKNMRFIQMMMGSVSDMVKISYEFTEDFLYWRDPDKSQMLIKEALKLPLGIIIIIYYVPIRQCLIVGLWMATLSNSQFFVTISRVFITKLLEQTHKINKKQIYEFIAIKKDQITNFELPFSSLIFTIRSYIQQKFNLTQKQRFRNERSITFEEQDIGEEHTDNTPFSGNSKLPHVRIKKMRQSIEYAQDNFEENLDINQELRKKPNEINVLRNSQNLNLRIEQLDQEPKDRFRISRGSARAILNKETLEKLDNVQEDENLFNPVQDDDYYSLSDNENDYEEDDDVLVPDHTYFNNNNKPQDDKQIQRKIFVTYENQRWWLSSWTSTLLPGERHSWSDQKGEMQLPKEAFKLPSKDWEWEDIWHVDKHPEFTDDDGWSYGVDFSSPFHKHQGMFDVVRKRKWVRVCKKKNSTPHKESKANSTSNYNTPHRK
ncbi:tectonin beta-propeller repeat-containing protein 1 [Stylonychia lemnae]|uniref:Tectonin beta-propeller repeat-containing protein 1 n=1 Tax=Stylonychia lemnae TaxID=5949 RepID=A0A077ZXR2_STYLE|nr:tectonin beta-propeller repeat-containing protein 1 [Stylonychia lemnae]|eukprot:CDW73311.1 tectonin beta-propeller repeat-containing protein 1 [Stylonychia lemnae]